MTEDYGFPVLFHLLCKRENWHKIQNGNRAGKSQGGLLYFVRIRRAEKEANQTDDAHGYRYRPRIQLGKYGS